MSNDTPLEGKDARWGEVQSKALKVLEHPERLQPRRPLEGRVPVLRLWRYPAGSDWLSWTLFRPFERSSPALVRRVLWRAERDRPRVFDPVEALRLGADPLPTIELADLRLEREAEEGILDDFAALAPPPIDVWKPSGEGGVVFGVRDLSSDDGLWLTWWNQGPAEWGPFVRFSDEVRGKLEAEAFPSARG